MSIESWYKSLPEHKKDVVIGVINDICSACAPQKIEYLEKKLKDTTYIINRINKKRESIGMEINNANSMLAEMKDSAEKGNDPEIMLLSAFISARLVYLRDLQSSLKPNEKLTEKHDVATRLEHLKQANDVAQTLLRIIDGAGTG